MGDTIQELAWAFMTLTIAVAFGMVYRKKTSPTEAPKHPVRKTILDFVLRRPGSRTTAIWKELGINRGTAHHHLFVLERIGAIKAVRGEKTTRYFPPETDPRVAPQLSLLMSDRVLQVVDAILREPGIAQHKLTNNLPIKRKVFRRYANQLVGAKLVREERDGRAHRYFPTEALRERREDISRLSEKDRKTNPGDDVPGGARP